MRKFVLFVLIVSATFLVACQTKETVVEETPPPPVKEVSKPNPPVKQIVQKPVKQPEPQPKVEEPVKQPEPAPEPHPEPKVEEIVKQPEPAPEPKIEEPVKQPDPIPEPQPEPEPKVEEIVKKPEPVKQPDPVEEARVDEEYLRSISGMESGEVSRADFEDDKRKILEIIDELADIMSSYNYDDWLPYIEPDSVTYWQNAKNLASASQRLPVSVRAQLPSKRLKNLRVFFSFVFVPARKGRVVDEIRYISPESVKAVDVTDDSDVIYYNFKKIDGKWFIHLPASGN